MEKPQPLSRSPRKRRKKPCGLDAEWNEACRKTGLSRGAKHGSARGGYDGGVAEGERDLQPFASDEPASGANLRDRGELSPREGKDQRGSPGEGCRGGENGRPRPKCGPGIEIGHVD